jgi:hypothetical protein
MMPSRRALLCALAAALPLAVAAQGAAKPGPTSR